MLKLSSSIMAVEIVLSGNIRTDFIGIEKLYQFYANSSKHFDQIIVLNFYNLKFLDGNLCALLLSMIYRLQKSNNLSFTINHEYIKTEFNVFVRNGFVKIKEGFDDNQKSTVNLQLFDVKNLNHFVAYIQNDLMQHRGINLSPETSNTIIEALIEIATNIEIHSNSSEPFFACGQFFPESGVLKFSIVDLGNGFLPAIKSKTNGDILTDYESIEWALKQGNTTKMNAPGGFGLSDLQNLFVNSNGDLQIITGNAFWSTEFINSTINYQEFSTRCHGTMINLLFSYN